MKYKIMKLKRLSDELLAIEKRQLTEINKFNLFNNEEKNVDSFKASKVEPMTFKSEETWGHHDLSAWFELPRLEVSTNKILSVDIWTTKDGWDAINPQFLLYKNGIATGSYDTNHHEVIIGKEISINDELLIHAYSGLKKNSRPTIYCQICEIDEDIRNFRILVKNIIATIELLDDNDYEKICLVENTIKVLNQLNFYHKEDEIFVNEIKNATIELNKNLQSTSETTVYGVGHTHIDIAWQWTIEQTREKVARSFVNVLYLMDRYPEYKFISSQPLLYEFVKEDHPDIFARIVERIKEGRWEVEGAMFVESDCILPSGESLIRQIQLGKSTVKNLFNVENEILWLPDAFGYSPALPQIINKSGIKYFMTTKMSWNRYNRHPFDLFNWRGLDGSEVLSYMITTPEENSVNMSHFTTYNGVLTPYTLKGTWDNFGQKKNSNKVLTCYGYGDGGGGTTFDMIETGKIFENGIASLPKFKFSTAKDFFVDLERDIDKNDIPTWDGELYLEYHRGTYTSMGKNKKYNRVIENDLTVVEKIDALFDYSNIDVDKIDLKNSWKKVLINQFHDILPGSSIKEVYDKTDEEYQEISLEIDTFYNSLAKSFSNEFSVFNSRNFKRDDFLVFETIPENANSLECNGEFFPIQKTHDNKFISYVKGLKAFSWTTLKFSDREVALDECKFVDNTISTTNSTIIFNENGEIEQLFFKDKNFVKNDSSLNELRVFEDIPYENDNWDIEEYYAQKQYDLELTSKLKLIENGPIRTVLQFEKKFNNSIVKQNIIISNLTNRIDFENDINWNDSQLLLKTMFNSDVNTSFAKYDVQFGNVTRSTLANTNIEKAKFEVWHHKWLKLEEAKHSFSILNDSKYGVSVEKNTIGLTLIKSGIFPNPVSDRCQHEIKYSIYINNDDSDYNTDNEAWKINDKLIISDVHSDLVDIVSCPDENIDISAFYQSEEGIIVRWYEKNNQSTRSSITINDKVKEVFLTDMLENKLEQKEIIDGKFELKFKPFEIHTLLLKY